MSEYYYIVGASRPRATGLANIKPSIHMYFEECDYSHIHLEFPPGTFMDNPIFFEARNGQVNFTNVETFEKKTIEVRRYAVPCTLEEIQAILKFCWTYCGIDYGENQLTGAVISKLADYVGLEVKNVFADGMRTEICSSIASRIMKISGFDIIGDIESKNPKDVIKLLEDGDFERLL